MTGANGICPTAASLLLVKRAGIHTRTKTYLPGTIQNSVEGFLWFSFDCFQVVQLALEAYPQLVKVSNAPLLRVMHVMAECHVIAAADTMSLLHVSLCQSPIFTRRICSQARITHRLMHQSCIIIHERGNMKLEIVSHEWNLGLMERDRCT
jgi:hypothetical protein